ncbi:MAG: response regulator [Candidatus Binatia bacterium]
MPTGQNFTLRILVVDGYRGNINSLSAHLKGLAVPLQIMTATDYESTIARLQIETLDLLIIDTCLRGRMDGYDLCRALRSSASTQALPIILILSGCLSLERAKGMAAGADLLLHRPIVKQELLKMLQLLLGSKFEQAQNSRPTPEEASIRILRSVS